MWIKSLQLKNIRSFAEATLEFSKGINGRATGPRNENEPGNDEPVLEWQEVAFSPDP